jgi:hypothetical protein
MKGINGQVSALPVVSVNSVRAINALGITIGADFHLYPIEWRITIFNDALQ